MSERIGRCPRDHSDRIHTTNGNDDGVIECICFDCGWSGTTEEH